MQNITSVEDVNPYVGYVYALVDIRYPMLERCRYIGKTVVADLQERLRTHCAEAQRGMPSIRHDWIRSVLANGSSIDLIIIEVHTSSNRQSVDRTVKEREKAWIACGRHLGWNLTNDTDGGEGSRIGYLVRGVDLCTAEGGCSDVIAYRGLCNRHIRRLRLYGSTEEPPPRYPPLAERFWSKVDIRGENECWEWTASLSSTGYGQFQMGGHEGKPEKATRIALKLSGVEVPDHLHALHRCDNPLCVNPNHLYMGTDKDNVRDMYERGRGVMGTQHPLSKLTDDDVREIRRLVGEGILSQTKTATKFGVTQMAISKIVHRRSWKHIE